MSHQVQAELTQTPKFGDHTDLFDGMLLAFEQTDFCDFEIQFEVSEIMDRVNGSLRARLLNE